MLTLRRAWEDHYRPFIEPDSAEQTIRCYETTVKAWERWGSAALPLCSMRAQDFSDFKRRVLGVPRAAATLNRYLREMRAILNFMASEGHIDRVPQLRPTTEPEQCKERPTPDQVGQLFAAVRAADLRWPIGPPGFAIDWWQSFIVWGYVGAFRKSELRLLTMDHVTEDGIEFLTGKAKRLQFAPAFPCVVRQVHRMRAWLTPGRSQLLSGGHGGRQFRMARDAIGEAVGFEWRPHGLKRASIDAWFATSETAGIIVSHGRKSTAVRNYLDRKKWLMKVASRFEIPQEFADDRQLRLF